MKIVIAMDSFKGSMSSLEAGCAARDGILSVMPEADIRVFPVADGGEGTVEALTYVLGGNSCEIRVTGPLGTPVYAKYGILPDNRTAVMEIASAAGLTLVPEARRNPLGTTTYGVGEMIRHAIRRGCRRFLIGIGGSATNDGGLGMLQALGFDFVDEAGAPVAPYGAGLGEVAAIYGDHIEPWLLDCEFRIACDVNNPLCGPNGASAVYGPQKGAVPNLVREMDAWMARYAELSHGDPDVPGSGAAGGLGYAFRTFLGAELIPGIQIIMEETGLEDAIREADLVITGEGRLDAQTAMGKGPGGIAELAGAYGKRVIAVAGEAVQKDFVRKDPKTGEMCGTELAALFDAVYLITPESMPPEIALRTDVACQNMFDTAARLAEEL